jgi:glycosyltransferase involved in cell wall biosynthesis
MPGVFRITPKLASCAASNFDLSAHSTSRPTSFASGAPAWTKARVAILLCTLNGDRFLSDQLTSIAAQSHSDWRLIVSDDGSRDATRNIVESFAAIQLDRSRVELRDGPRCGPTANFLSLACDQMIEADCYAYCDQDDIWVRDKLANAIGWLQSVPDHVPALYCSRTRLITADGRAYGYSPLFSRPPTFRNALIQNLGGGNTMVFNRAAQNLLVRSAGVEVVAHDWWTYMLVMGAGGQVFYDPEPSVDYRQHGQNQVGANGGLSGTKKRLRMIADGNFLRWNVINTRALERCADLLTPENHTLLRSFHEIRTGSTGLRRLSSLLRTGIYRQTKCGQMALVAAALFARV